jgi:hypothetical protein
MAEETVIENEIFMTRDEFLKEIDWIHQKFEESIGEVGFGEYQNRLSWLVDYYKTGGSKDNWRKY